MLEAVQKYWPPKSALILVVLGWYAFNLVFSNSLWASVLLGFALVFLVPGYSWVDSLARTDDQIERLVLAVAISISLVILSIVWMNLVFRIPISQATVFADIAVISLSGLAWEARGLFGSSDTRVSSPPVEKGAKKRKKK